MTRQTLVTGASGFVGRRLVGKLKTHGFRVKGVYRSKPQEAQEADGYVMREITAQTDWTGVFDDVDCVIHLADGLREFEGMDGACQEAARSQIQANVHFAQSALRAGVGTFLYVSSIKAMAGESAPKVLTEDWKPAPTSLYGRLKLDVERRLETLAQDSTTRLIIIRPPIVYGPGVGGNFARLLRLADTPWPLPLANLSNARSMIFVETLVDALVTAVGLEPGGGGVFLVHDGRPLTMPELMQHLRAGLGRAQRLFAVPLPVWDGLAAVSRLRPLVHRLTGSLAVSDSLFCEQFGWRPQLAAEHALMQTAKSSKGGAASRERP